MLVDQLSAEVVGASTSVGPSQGSAWETTPSEMPAHRQALRCGPVECPSLPDERTSSIVALRGSNEKPGVLSCDQQRQSEQEAAEQRRLVRKARELEEQVKVGIANSLRSCIADLYHVGA